MDLLKLLQTEIQEFINSNVSSNINQLALKKNPFTEIDYSILINQIAAKQKAKDKLPTWFTTANVIFPAKISIEQTSSEKTAAYKASLVSGNKLIDLTGGFGIDDFYFSKKIDNVYHCEMNETLSAIVQYNYTILKANNIKCIHVNSTIYLEESTETFDWIYVDPSRRNDIKGKVFMLKDCEPNVPNLLPLYFSKSNKILIKTAPILDLHAGLIELKNVKKIHIIAVENEVKELLWEIEKDYVGKTSLLSVNLEKNKEYKFETDFDKHYIATFSLPKQYLFEPNASILKSGSFNAVSEIYNCAKLHQHSHLYTSNELIDFPGRRFKIEKNLSYQKNDLKAFIQNQKMNITTRNFPLKVDEIRSKFKIKDGGNLYAFFTTNLENQKIILICTKI